MIVVTGGAGFIGSCFIGKLNQEGITDILVVDQLDADEKWMNLRGKKFLDYMEKDDFLARLNAKTPPHGISEIYHIGACSSTTESDASFLLKNNYEYSKRLAEYAFANDLYFCYASSAATYGDGAEGYSDDESSLEKLQPLNMYGFSKHMFDLWLLRNGHLDKVIGFKYFNVFGPNEYHKGDMCSVICKAYDQIMRTGKLKLFKSYRPDYKDGEQKRDFVYIKDVVDVMFLMSRKKDIRGIYNLGTGAAHTWNRLAKAIFTAMNKKCNIDYIDMPEEIKAKYQYFTQADMCKFKKLGPGFEFSTLEESVKDYVQNYLMSENKYL
jgi:ADP-L-glycero-D-manno-heptose 6-epimerase